MAPFLDPLTVAESQPLGTPPDQLRVAYQRELRRVLHQQLDAVLDTNLADLELAALSGPTLRVTISTEAEESDTVFTGAVAQAIHEGAVPPLTTDERAQVEGHLADHRRLKLVTDTTH